MLTMVKFMIALLIGGAIGCFATAICSVGGYEEAYEEAYKKGFEDGVNSIKNG